MLISRITVLLNPKDAGALTELALPEYRDSSVHAVIRREFERRGLLTAQIGESIQPAEQAQEVQDIAV